MSDDVVPLENFRNIKMYICAKFGEFSMAMEDAV